MHLGDLINPALLANPSATGPSLMAGTIADVSPLRVKVPSIDGGKFAISAFGTLVGAGEGDPVRVMRDENGAVVVVAWESIAPLEPS